MKHLFTAKLKVVRHHGNEQIGHGTDKFHLIEADSETEAREKLEDFYKKKGEHSKAQFELRGVDIEPIIK